MVSNGREVYREGEKRSRKQEQEQEEAESEGRAGTTGGGWWAHTHHIENAWFASVWEVNE